MLSNPSLAVMLFDAIDRAVRPRGRLIIAITLCIATCISACAPLQRVLSRDESQQRAIRLQEIQLKVMRYADEYAAGVNDPLSRFAAQTQSPDERLAAQNWLLSQSTSAYTVASGPNPVINALDMVVLATLSRIVVEDYWRDELYGARASQLLEVHRKLESQAWTLIQDVLDAEQIVQLHAMIDAWRAEHPQVRGVAHIHFSDFAKTISRPKNEETQSRGSLFALIGLDPLGNLDPAVRELEQTRQLAERTIYYVQRMPNLLDMQVERLTYQLASMPETKSLLVDANRLSAGVESAGLLAQQLPIAFAKEREAALAQLQAVLVSEQAQLQQLLVEMRATLQAGTETSTAVHGALAKFDELALRLRSTKTPSDKPAGRPFDITEYTATARELAGAARELQGLVGELDTTRITAITSEAGTTLTQVVDHLFWRLLQLVFVFVVASTVCVVGTRWLWVRMRGREAV